MFSKKLGLIVQILAAMLVAVGLIALNHSGSTDYTAGAGVEPYPVNVEYVDPDRRQHSRQELAEARSKVSESLRALEAGLPDDGSVQQTRAKILDMGMRCLSLIAKSKHAQECANTCSNGLKTLSKNDRKFAKSVSRVTCEIQYQKVFPDMAYVQRQVLAHQLYPEREMERLEPAAMMRLIDVLDGQEPGKRRLGLLYLGRYCATSKAGGSQASACSSRCEGGFRSFPNNGRTTVPDGDPREPEYHKAWLACKRDFQIYHDDIA